MKEAALLVIQFSLGMNESPSTIFCKFAKIFSKLELQMNIEVFLFLCFPWDVSFLHGLEKEHFSFCFFTQILSGKLFQSVELPVAALSQRQENQNRSLLGIKRYQFQPLKEGESIKSGNLFCWLRVLANESFKQPKQLSDSNPFFRLFLLTQFQKG